MLNHVAEATSTEGARSGNAEAKARMLLELIGELLGAGPEQSGRRIEVRLDSRLEKDLGLDSLGRTELFGRVERRFSVSLPEEALLSETPRDLLEAVLRARGVTAGELPENGGGR